MKLFKNSKSLSFSCDECNRKLDKDEQAILIGESSSKFLDDTRQSLICGNCIEKAFKIFSGS